MKNKLKAVTVFLPLATLFSLLVGLSGSVSAKACVAGSTCVSVSNNDDAYSKEMARQEKEQWDETRSLRQKVNKRTEKEFDKVEQAIDSREACLESSNLNAYWEDNTNRCLDRSTGRTIR